jgi:hypothetical protein
MLSFDKKEIICYPVNNGIPCFVGPEFYQGGLALPTVEVQTGVKPSKP